MSLPPGKAGPEQQDAMVTEKHKKYMPLDTQALNSLGNGLLRGFIWIEPFKVQTMQLEKLVLLLYGHI